MAKTSKTLSAFQMAKRICERSDNIYDKKIFNRQVINNILSMYMDECRKALLDGEKIKLDKVGMIVPEIKVHMRTFNLPMCNKEGGNPPSTKLKINRSISLRDHMNSRLLKNMENGIYGLDKLPFSKQQMKILKDNGYLPENEGMEEGEDEE